MLNLQTNCCLKLGFQKVDLMLQPFINESRYMLTTLVNIVVSADIVTSHVWCKWVSDLKGWDAPLQ